MLRVGWHVCKLHMSAFDSQEGAGSVALLLGQAAVHENQLDGLLRKRWPVHTAEVSSQVHPGEEFREHLLLEQELLRGCRPRHLLQELYIMLWPQVRYRVCSEGELLEQHLQGPGLYPQGRLHLLHEGGNMHELLLPSGLGAEGEGREDLLHRQDLQDHSFPDMLCPERYVRHAPLSAWAGAQGRSDVHPLLGLDLR
jgi:hypothetical protein